MKNSSQVYWKLHPGWGWLLLHLLPVPACALSQLLPASSWCSIPGAGPGPGLVTGFPLTAGVVMVTAWLHGQGLHHAGEGALSWHELDKPSQGEGC